MSEPEIVTEQRGHVLVVRLNRPEARNAISPGIMQGLGRALIDADADPDVRVVVLTGTGDRAFCSGLDLRAFAEGNSTSEDADAMAAFMRVLRADHVVPWVGAANATAVAGGLELLMGCDVIVASSEAKFGLPEVKRGLFPGGGGTRLGQRIPLHVANELLLTGDTISAERAYELGFVNSVVAPDQVLTAAIELAERIAANAPLGVAAARELAHLWVNDPARAQQRLEELQPIVFQSEDAREGAMAFVEKRPAEWKGR